MVNILLVLMLLILSLAVMGNSMTKPVGRDEQMYCTGAALTAQGKMIYRDFSYAAQMPYHPLLCATLFRLFGTTHYLLTVRLLSCVCDILVMLCILGIYRHVFKSFAVSGMLLGLAAVVLYLFNPLVDYANGYAWNHDVVVLCVVASLWLFISIDSQEKTQRWRIAAIGGLLTFATCMRVTTALVELLFFVMVLSLPAGSIKQRFKTALPFLAATLLVLIWPVWVIGQAPRAFFLNMVKIPILYGQWLHEIGMVHNKTDLTIACLTTPAYFVIVMLTVFLGLMMLFLWRKFKMPDARNMLLAALLPVVFFVIALIPPTMWRQYLAIPVPFWVIGFAFPLFHLRQLGGKAAIGRHFRMAAAAMAVSASLTVLSYPFVLGRVPLALVPESWVPRELHKVSEDIVEKTKEPGLILSLAPLLVIEGGGEIYTQLSCGSIIYRIADSLSPEDRLTTNTVGLETLSQLVEENPPSAIILGNEYDKMAVLEIPLKRIVEDDWKREDYDFGPTVYFRP
ncbi:MAG: hypothetical protein ACYTFQ_24200, partial [Planctomycetota bacterium]|jgi:4-amino-4-deoxy-L-arabinose transferase-like glycosyltransferase